MAAPRQSRAAPRARRPRTRTSRPDMLYSAQRVRSKTRAAVKRREDAIELDEMESGELNLIPYLDMVTNLMLFLLASVSAGLILVQINTPLPDPKADPPGGTPTPAASPPRPP